MGNGICVPFWKQTEDQHLDSIIGTLLLPNLLLAQFLISFVLATGLGMFIMVVYRFTHRGMNYESSFLTSIVMLSPIVTLVMFFIQGDLVLSLGLVGSLSIIRFRTPIKDTRDMVFLFWTIATGLGCGTLNWTISFLSALLMAGVMTLFYLVKYGKPLHAEYILIVQGDEAGDRVGVEQRLNPSKVHVQIRSHEVEGSNWEIIFELRSRKDHEGAIHEMMEEIRQLEGVRKVSLLSPQLTLPM